MSHSAYRIWYDAGRYTNCCTCDGAAKLFAGGLATLVLLFHSRLHLLMDPWVKPEGKG